MQSPIANVERIGAKGRRRGGSAHQTRRWAKRISAAKFWRAGAVCVFGVLGLAAMIGAGELAGRAEEKSAAKSISRPSTEAPAGSSQGGKIHAETPLFVPFLGIMSVESTAKQRETAGLPEGIGITVLYVVRDSPAQAAGVRPFDVLHKFNDQILVNEPQLRVLVRNTKPGDLVELTLYRAGKPLAATARVAEREVVVVQGTPGNAGMWAIGPGPAGAPPVAAQVFSARYEDEAHVMELKSDAKGKYLIARDKKRGVVFEGPVSTADQRKVLPEDLRSKLEKLETPPPAKVHAVPAPPPQPKPGLSQGGASLSGPSKTSALG